ncbi:MAG: histidine phosphatase family protein [Pseudorhodoplanes sp.]
MRRLMLLRHAKSDWSLPGQSDHERALASRGRKAAPLMGRYMAEHDMIPDHAIVSTAARTRATWQLVSDMFPRSPPADFEDRIYEASPREILAAIARAPASAQTLLVVGHNPGFHETANLLVGSGDRRMRECLSEKFPTAALAVIDLDIDDWRAIGRGSGRLERFVTPRAIDRTSD